MIVYVSYYVLISTLEKTNPEQAPKDPCEGRVRSGKLVRKGHSQEFTFTIIPVNGQRIMAE